MDFILALITVLLPVATGYALGRCRPALSALLVSLLSSLPLVLAFGLLVMALAGGEYAAPFGLAAAVVFGLVALLCGFGLGMVGHMLATRRASK